MAVADNHPPPTSPYQLHQEHPQPSPQAQPAQQRPTHKSRKSRAFSFRSDKSHKSQGSGSHKIDLHETSAEKEAKRLHSKADPTLAMQEAEPSEVAAMVKSSLAPLRAIQHKDAFGNPIADPDLSNPTRSRWERPLDTIRSFEAAIDGGYSNRRSIISPETDGPTWGSSRRASYYGGNGGGGRFTHDSYYGSRPASMMYANRGDGSQPDLRLGGNGQRDSYYDYQPGPSAPNGRRAWPRTGSEPQFPSPSRQQNPQGYPGPSNHRSYETVTTASGSGSLGEPAGYQTDPTSSDNGSIDRVQSIPRRQPEPINDYGISFSSSPSSYQPTSFSVGMQGSSMNGASGPVNYGVAAPPVPQKEPTPVLRKAMTAGPVQQQQQQQQQQQRPVQPEKRKSWFTRRFSKH